MDESKDKISVIIPFFKGKKWLEEAIKTVLKQSFPPYEIIVINDGSPENIDDLIIKYQQKVSFVFQNNEGAASARNHGIRISTGDYIAFLDSDDLWYPNKLEVQLKYMKERKLYWTHCPYKIFEDKTYKIIKKISNQDVTGMVFPRTLARCNIATPCVMIKKECLNDLHVYFNEKMRQGQDYCFWNVLAKKYEIGNTNQSLVLVRSHTTNTSKNIIAQLKSKSMMYDYVKKNAAYFGRIPLVLRLAFRLSQFGYSIVNKVNNPEIMKMISYIVYLVPWGLFRTYYLVVKGNSKTS